MASIRSKRKQFRKPRVHIKNVVETEGARVERELPLVVGVTGDFSVQPTERLKPLRDRKFTQIGRDNFDEVLAPMMPGVELRIDNTLADNGTEMPISLKFSTMDDFAPAAVVAQVPALKSLMETRNQLRELLSKADRSEGLETLLGRILQNNVDLKQLAEELKLHQTDSHHATCNRPSRLNADGTERPIGANTANSRPSTVRADEQGDR
jgi:type VI secretion system protein ImpB